MIGRKNWPFCGSGNGGTAAAVLMSVYASCKQHGGNTFAHIRDMLVRVSTEPASCVREILPGRWKAERDAANREVAAAVMITQDDFETAARAAAGSAGVIGFRR